MAVRNDDGSFKMRESKFRNYIAVGGRFPPEKGEWEAGGTAPISLVASTGHPVGSVQLANAARLLPADLGIWGSGNG